MKIIDQSIALSQSMFPKVYAERENKYRTFHFAFAWRRNELLGIGQNDPEHPNHKALRFAKRFQINKQLKYPYLHAEVDLIGKLWSKVYIDNRLKIVVLRLNRQSKLVNSKPCKSCSTVFDALNLKRVWWSDKYGNIVTE